jgi:DNA-binding LacI/PurR family transcriptional regulator
MAVIRDVAKMAGVSTATVSKVINKPHTVKESTRNKVLEVMKELNYTPSPTAQSMRTGRTGNIGIISPDISNPFFAELFSKLRAQVITRGYTPILYSVEDDRVALINWVTKLSIRQLDALITCFVDDYIDIDEFIGDLEDRIPIVIISWNMNNSKHNSIIVDVFEGMYKSTRNLISSGRKRLAYIGGPERSRISREKYAGFCSAVNEAGIDVKSTYFQCGEYLPQTGYLSTQAFMMNMKPPDAIVCANDIIAVGCMKYLLNMGKKIPEDVAVTGFDNIAFSSIYEPSLTTVSIPLEKTGEMAVDILMNTIHGKYTKRKCLVMKTELIIRRSTDPNAPIEL